MNSGQRTMPPPINTGGYPPQGGPPHYANPPQYGSPPMNNMVPQQYQQRNNAVEVEGAGRSKAQLIVGIDFVSLDCSDALTLLMR